MLKLKRFFLFLFLTTLGLAGMVSLSLLGENDYLENCHHLNLDCEPGRVHKALNHISTLCDSTLKKLTELWENKGKENPQTP